MTKIGIIGAMNAEVSYLKSIATDKNETQAGSLTFVEGKINGTNVVIVQSGIGKVNAALCAQRLILSYGVTHIINTGIAGAAAEGLDVLDFVVSTDAVYHDMDTTGFGYKPTEIPQMKVSAFEADKAMISAALSAWDSLKESDDFKGHKLIAGRIASGDQFISNKQVKQHIIDICHPGCVEMEGAAIAHASYLNNTPYLVLRCMSDCADDGHESIYDFNEQTAANMSAKLVVEVLSKIS